MKTTEEMSGSYSYRKKTDEPEDLFKQIVCFVLHGQVYGIDIENVIEVISKPEDITPVINTPEFIVGMINLRGEIIPVIDLKNFFEINDNNENRNDNIVIVRHESKIAGLSVDNITEIKKVANLSADSLPATVSGKISSFLKGVINDYNEPVTVINIGNIFESEELKQFE